MKIRKDLVDIVYFGFFGLLIILFLTGQFSSLTGTTLVVIDNPDPNSMFPTYFQGDLFIIYKNQPESIEIGDVVVYTLNNGNSRIIHRVIDIELVDGQYYYRVKGDNPVTNYSPDIANGGTLISFEQLIGKVVGRIPFIGHYSLAMQRNFAVQFLIYLSAFAIAIVVIFAPNDENEDEEKYHDISRENYSVWKNQQTERVKSFFWLAFKSRYRILGIAFTLILIMMILVPLFVPVLVPMSYDEPIGVTEIEINRDIRISESLPGVGVQFYNLSIHIFDDTSRFTKILGYTLNVRTLAGDIIDTTIWDTSRTMKGQFVVGGSITIDEDIFATFPDGTELQAEVTLQIQRGFSVEELANLT
ncbi:MAG: signal peptidase I [Candidatus Kariarchaeaceae archaeon]